jgi:hypothetical protein
VVILDVPYLQHTTATGAEKALFQPPVCPIRAAYAVFKLLFCELLWRVLFYP